ncbi:MAG TPA: methyltransferase domain-containing protein, partial [Kiritimatiellia bacterium]
MSAIGTEVSPESAEYGIKNERLDIRIGLLENLKLPAASFDIVLLHDVIEHVPSPMQIVKECARLMAKGGVICIHTVNVESLTARVAKQDFFLADTTGGHATLFSPATLSRYCREAGLEPVEITTRGFRVVQRERDREAMGWNRAFVRLVENIAHEVVKPCGLGHFINVVARKA